jgi:predicted MFS family arabinose efflux permease
VPLTQSLAILSLIFLALSELGAGTTGGLVLAIFFYTLRQPLMNMAAPMTSEVTMMYVGERNREMMSALTASIWSGSWFISAWIFEILREEKVRYMNIFFITALLYALGVLAYMLLIRKHEKKNPSA